MDREPIFYINELMHNDELTTVYQGKVLDRIKIGDVLYTSSETNKDYRCYVESIEINGREVNQVTAFTVVSLKIRWVLRTNENVEGNYLYDLVEKYTPTIDYFEARRLAESSAFEDLNWLRKDQATPLLREEFCEAECCWFFFRNKDLVGPSEKNLIWDRAFVVSKMGNVFSIADLSDEPDRLFDYLQRYSSHVKRRKE